MNNTILVTGCSGYIGSALTNQLLAKGYTVIGVDKLAFGGDAMLTFFDNPKFHFHKLDIVNFEAMKELFQKYGISGVVHLAAVVGDPACKAEPALAKEVNVNGTKNLFLAANLSPSVKKFIFASTCSNYGKMEGGGFVNEESNLNPVSLYAETKVEVEKFLFSSEKRDDLAPVVLRFSTAYGTSGRPRFDLTVNEFVRDAVEDKEIVIFGEYFWRPYCHVSDLALACILALEAKPELVRNQVYGVGATDENYQKKMLSDILLKINPKLKFKFVEQADDPRDYRVNFDKIKYKLGFSPLRKVPIMMEKMYGMLKVGIISETRNKTFNNLSR